MSEQTYTDSQTNKLIAGLLGAAILARYGFAIGSGLVGGEANDSPIDGAGAMLDNGSTSRLVASVIASLVAGSVGGYLGYTYLARFAAYRTQAVEKEGPHRQDRGDNSGLFGEGVGTNQDDFEWTEQILSLLDDVNDFNTGGNNHPRLIWEAALADMTPEEKDPANLQKLYDNFNAVHIYVIASGQGSVWDSQGVSLKNLREATTTGKGSWTYGATNSDRIDWALLLYAAVSTQISAMSSSALDLLARTNQATFSAKWAEYIELARTQSAAAGEDFTAPPEPNFENLQTNGATESGADQLSILGFLSNNFSLYNIQDISNNGGAVYDQVSGEYTIKKSLVDEYMGQQTNFTWNNTDPLYQNTYNNFAD